ncbi:ABC transporter permease [Bacteroidota bacterium]
MQILQSIAMAWDSLRTNKLRSSLTLLGIGIGLFSIIIVMTAIGAVQQSVEDVFNSIGTTNFIIQKYPAIRMGPGSRAKYRNRKDLTIAQGLKLKEVTTSPLAVGVGLGRSSKVIKFGNLATNPDIYIYGGNLDQYRTMELTIEEGRGFGMQDMEVIRNVCILGSEVKDKLFPSINPIGQKVRVEDMNLEVVGVYEKRGSILGQSRDKFITIPLPLYIKQYGDKSNASYTILASSKETIQRTMDEVTAVLRVIRKVPLGEDNDFEIVTNDQLIEQFNDITKYFKIGAGVISFIALVAAGVGIMNIMLVSVTERTREIGIRKAIGAKKRIIRSQFLVEAIFLSQIGGIIGIVLGVLGGNLVAAFLGVAAVVPIDWIMLGIIVTTIVGVSFGVYPAIKASNLDPIEALRYE